MNKIAALFIILIIVLALGSCDGGSPPELYLSFQIDDVDLVDDYAEVDYTLENGGDTDLENCKIQIAIDTDSATSREYNYKKWTNGFDLDSGQSRSVTNFKIDVESNTIYDAYIIASGFDNPTEADKSARTTIIYYDE